MYTTTHSTLIDSEATQGGWWLGLLAGVLVFIQLPDSLRKVYGYETAGVLCNFLRLSIYNQVLRLCHTNNEPRFSR